MQHMVFFKIMLILFGVATKAISLNEITASDSASNDRFGNSVSVSGTTAIVGAPYKNSYQGAAYIFTCAILSNWTQASKLLASDGASGDYFGDSVSISGTIAIVGAPLKKIGPNSRQGATYIFSCATPSNCTQTSELVASDGASANYFGCSVGISGTTVIVGAYGFNSVQGAVYIFTCATPSNCTQASELVASDGAAGDFFGSSVSISGTTVIVGAYFKNIGDNSHQGAAYIFSCATPSNCTQASELFASDGAAYDQFGFSVSISGTTAIVSARDKNSYQGAAYIFSCATPSNCIQGSELSTSDGAAYDQFGSSVSISGTTAIVGAYVKNSYQGAAYIFTCDTPSNCIQASELLAISGTSDYFGISVSISGTTAIVGASDQDAAYVVDLSTITLSSSSSGGIVGNFPGTLNGTINLKSCSVYLNGASLSGYAIVDSQNGNSFCCLQKGVIHGASCVRGSCANPIAFGLFATIIGDSTDCLVDCISSSSSAQNSVYVSVLSATSGSIYAGTPQGISISLSQESFLVLNGAYIPVYSFFVGSQQYACLIQGQYDGSSTCHYTTGCNAASSVIINFFFDATSGSCYITCYPV